MTKYTCEYCGIRLAHSGVGTRRQHNKGKKHIQNKVEYYNNIVKEKGIPASVLSSMAAAMALNKQS